MMKPEFLEYVLSSGLFTVWPAQFRFDETKFNNQLTLVIREQPASSTLNTVTQTYDIYLMGRENKPSDEPDLESKIWQLRQFIYGYLTDELLYPKFNCIIETEIVSEPRFFGETDTNRIIYSMSVSILTPTNSLRG